jgi:methyl-accepting chemotaxis protein
MNIKSKFLVYFLGFALIPTLVGGIVSYVETTNSNINTAYTTLSSEEKLAEVAIKSKVNSEENLARQVSSDVPVSQYVTKYNSGSNDANLKQSVNSEFSDILKNNDDLENIAITDKNGVCIASGINSLEGTNLSQMNYFINAKNNNSTYVSPVKKSIVTGNPIVVVSTPILDGNNNFIGIVLESVSLKDLSKSFIDNTSIDNTGEFYIVQTDGTMVANKNPKEVLKKDLLNTAEGKAIVSSKSGSKSYNYLGVNSLCVYNYDSKLGWIFVANIPTSEVSQTSLGVIKITFSVIALTIIISIILSLAIAKRISGPILKLSEVMKKTAEGDFTVEIEKDSNDEIGHMTEKLSHTISGMRNSIGLIKNCSVDIDNSSEMLYTTSSDMVSTVNEVANAIGEVASGATTQAQDLMDIVNKLSDFSDELDETNSKLDKVNNGISEAESKALDGNTQVDLLIQSLVDVKNAFDGVVERINGLGDAVSQIGNITDAINDISEQTNLLALNAAIEAARAGEHGKGFAVVADEVRKLAEESKKSSEEIIELVKVIGSETKEVVDTTKSVEGFLEGQAEAANNTVITFYDIIEAVTNIATLMAEANASIGTIMEAKNSVSDKVQNVSAVAEEVSASAEEISASSEEMLASSEEVQNHARKMKDSATELMNDISKFKV